jgi:two-component system chemotaxis response regulator CheB
VKALQDLFRNLPRDIPAAIFVTLHIGRHDSILPEIISQYGFVARHARHGERILPRTVIVAPPDHHLLIHNGLLALSHGPRENWARPAIDPMFCSAALSYGGRVTGVVLSGYLNDGTAGLFEIKRRGGVAVVQDPNDAACPFMPSNALRRVDVDHCVTLAAMPAVLNQLAKAIARGKQELPPLASGGMRHA